MSNSATVNKKEKNASGALASPNVSEGKARCSTTVRRALPTGLSVTLFDGQKQTNLPEQYRTVVIALHTRILDTGLSEARQETTIPKTESLISHEHSHLYLFSAIHQVGVKVQSDICVLGKWLLLDSCRA